MRYVSAQFPFTKFYVEEKSQGNCHVQSIFWALAQEYSNYGYKGKSQGSHALTVKARGISKLEGQAKGATNVWLY